MRREAESIETLLPQGCMHGMSFALLPQSFDLPWRRQKTQKEADANSGPEACRSFDLPWKRQRVQKEVKPDGLPDGRRSFAGADRQVFRQVWIVSLGKSVRRTDSCQFS